VRVLSLVEVALLAQKSGVTVLLLSTSLFPACQHNVLTTLFLACQHDAVCMPAHCFLHASTMFPACKHRGIVRGVAEGSNGRIFARICVDVHCLPLPKC
jgi:hypothetical protein